MAMSVIDKLVYGIRHKSVGRVGEPNQWERDGQVHRSVPIESVGGSISLVLSSEEELTDPLKGFDLYGGMFAFLKQDNS